MDVENDVIISFSCSEEDDIDSDRGKTCVCVIL